MDSRASRPKHVRPLVRHLGVLRHGEPVYCVSCGRQEGWVTVDLPPGVIALCSACELRYGKPTEMMTKVDPEWHRSV